MKTKAHCRGNSENGEVTGSHHGILPVDVAEFLMGEEMFKVLPVVPLSCPGLFSSYFFKGPQKGERKRLRVFLLCHG